ncbi:hypothetical protein BDN71DRAFT_1435889 [Pleurotus eryngii]|uniref:Uncharacterized protein n=1 Tax=Pleurotus eryngii TaxID=5323 RepID=A0A9P5ZJQ7_PLEER|nr:hypothetical protein BDN71DRAFT_1435889 [Pleurotus eryngii]
MTNKFKPQDLSFNQIQLLKSFIKVVMKKLSDERIDFVINHMECTAKWKTYSTWVNALVESAMRECGFHPQSVLATQESDDFPSANILVNTCLTPVVVKMFGDVIMSGDILIDKAITVNLKTLLVHNISHMGKAYIRVGSVVDKKVKLMNNALKEAEENIMKLKEAVRHAMKWPRNGFDTPIRSQKPKANKNVEAARKKGCKINIIQAEMANEMEVTCMLQSIATHLEHVGNLENCPTEAEHHTYTEFLEKGDLGVEIMLKLSFEQLTILLSFVGGCPDNWNACVYKSK